MLLYLARKPLTITHNRLRILFSTCLILSLVIALFGFTLPSKASTTVITVNSNGDSATCSGGTMTLRCAIAAANANTTTLVLINFNFSGTIAVGSVLTLNNISQPITIDGSGQTIIIDGNNITEILAVLDHVTARFSTLTISHGLNSGVSNHGTLIISNSTISGSSYTLPYNGGGDGVNNLSTLTINNSTVSGNSGSGIVNNGTLAINNSTIAGNSTFESPGGGVLNVDGILTISNSTISGNSASLTGGGISNNYGTLYLLSTIVAGNSATSSPDVDAYTAVTSLGHNLIGDGMGSGMVNGINGDQVGTSGSPINPLLGSLASNGGPTQTLAIQSGSPAIGQGDCTGNTSVTPPMPTVGFDQRSVVRRAPCDVGAYESAFGSNPTVTTTFTPSNTFTPTSSSTNTNTPTNTATATATSTTTATNTATFTLTPNNTSTNTASVTSAPKPSKIDSIGVYRSGTFYLRLHNNQGFADLSAAFTVGTRPLPVVGDWTGAGFDSIGVIDQATANFYLRNTVSAGSADETFTLGNPNDTPLSGRWQLTATHSGVGVYRPSNGVLYLKNALSTGFADNAMVMGLPGDSGIAGDWTGKGFDSPGVFRPSGIMFYLSNQVTSGPVFADISLTYGSATDLPIAGDWIAQGHDGVGMFRPTNGFVYLKNAFTTGFADNSFFYGLSGDVPIAGHWQLTYPPIAPAPVLIAKTAMAPNGSSGSVIVPGDNRIGG